jgi:hypothetical protein
MANSEADRPLSEAERKQIFLTLVQAQDQMSVAQSRKEIVQRFGITDRQVRKIEQEGIDGEWPPLGE